MWSSRTRNLVARVLICRVDLVFNEKEFQLWARRQSMYNTWSQPLVLFRYYDQSNLIYWYIKFITALSQCFGRFVQGNLHGWPWSNGCWFDQCMCDVNGRRAASLRAIWLWQDCSCLHVSYNRHCMSMQNDNCVIMVSWHWMHHVGSNGYYFIIILDLYKTCNPPGVSQYWLNVAFHPQNGLRKMIG